MTLLFEVIDSDRLRFAFPQVTVPSTSWTGDRRNALTSMSTYLVGHTWDTRGCNLEGLPDELPSTHVVRLAQERGWRSREFGKEGVTSG